MDKERRHRRLWVVRHGMRIDFADTEWATTADRPYDPPLHAIGFEQAGETAERLALENINWIFASPFLRTVQTAHRIASRLGLPVKLEEGLAEWLRSDEFPYHPGYVSPEILRRDYPSVDTAYRSCSGVSFPESRLTLDARIQRGVAGILAGHPGDILIVTHASPINSIFRILAGIDLEEFQGMGAVSCFEYAVGGWRLVVDRDSSHLSNPDTTSRAFYSEWLGEERTT